ncbi:acyl-CoA synthetase [Pseudomonas sp. MPC6]|jgi:fatty-acyl-CoA synthase|uniref:acyl-CoA synthetase n=1 Tax=unclassified Pseudomonas TaxID=196821 RepID=UPI0011102CF5|nr:acyl-CoA synthetase [Pseudomonas sp. MPC6]QCY11617.1 acyl-CoA synthetase [Pseudomonas sp. MPC6]
MPGSNPYDLGLEQSPVNYRPLTPLGFIARTAQVYPQRLAVIHGARRYNWSETYDRVCRLSSALKAAGIGRGDTVVLIAANTPEMIEAHFGVPMCGAVLCTVNTRLDPAAIAYILMHCEARLVISDTEYASTIGQALALLEHRPRVIDIDDTEGPGGERLGELDYEAFIGAASTDEHGQEPVDEWQPIALNYTSGTTGRPKGVVYHHRGAYLAALSNMLDWQMPRHSIFLWTLPMFHCNGWGFVWTMAVNAGTHVCLRRCEPQRVLSMIRQHGVTHYCGAPVVHAMLAHAPKEWKAGISHRVHGLIGGAPPQLPVIAALHRMGIDLLQIYGLTEVYGPAVVCAEHQEWSELSTDLLTERKGRQGVRYTAQEDMAVLDPEDFTPVPRDGRSIGEVMFRGNMTMMGYLKDPQGTAEAFSGGWFHSGDLAVVHEDGYIQIRDRAKDIIISGGENISSVEVEEVLYRHPAVRTAAVVAMPHAKWGETPCAFVETSPDASIGEAELIAHCRSCLAHYKVPTRVIVGDLSKTATGKVRKVELREHALRLATRDAAIPID